MGREMPSQPTLLTCAPMRRANEGTPKALLYQKLRQVPIFAHLTDDKMTCLSGGEDYWLEEGALNSDEGDPATYFYVVLEGEIALSKRFNEAGEIRVETFGAGVYYGEIPLLLGVGYPLSARALTPCHLFRLDRDDFMAMLQDCPDIMGSILQTMALRIKSLQRFTNSREKLAALGTMAAGLAHELNNPAAAAQRAAAQLRDALPQAQALTLALAATLTPEEIRFLADFQAQLSTEAAVQRELVRQLDTLMRDDRESELADWLDAHNVDESWTLAPILLDAGVTLLHLDTIAARIAPSAHPVAVAWLASAMATTTLAGEIAHSAGRITDLVGAIKGYSYLDRAARQRVDLHEGIEDTLTILSHKLRRVSLIRDYDRELPPVWVRGGELNQVWTNLLDNAISATAGRGQIQIHTAREGDFALVEIVDNGPGIPLKLQSRIFEPFFTTKAIGEGSGLGLDISYRIVVREHGGDLQVESVPGTTRFQVRLPLNGTGKEEGNPPPTAPTVPEDQEEPPTIPSVAEASPDDTDEG